MGLGLEVRAIKTALSNRVSFLSPFLFLPPPPPTVVNLDSSPFLPSTIFRSFLPTRIPKEMGGRRRRNFFPSLFWKRGRTTVKSRGTSWLAVALLITRCGDGGTSPANEIHQGRFQVEVATYKNKIKEVAFPDKLYK